MELNKAEVLVVERTSADAREIHLQELSDLQLALVGGGIGETVL